MSAEPGPPASAKGNPKRSLSPDTLAVHAGEAPDLNAGSVVPPIYQTATYHYPAEFSEAREKGKVYLYTRIANPNQDQAAATVAALEGTESARVFSSGMAALSAVLLSQLKSGDQVVALEDLYGNTLELLRDLSTRWGVRVHWIRGEDSASIGERVPAGTRLLVMESPTNPTLRVHEIAGWAHAAHAAGGLLLVDNTFGTPINQNPVAHGADLVMHSATKYLGGHSDLIAGAIAGPAALLDPMDRTSMALGGSLDPMAAFLLSRGMKTLALRVKRHNENGKAVVEEAARHPAILRVDYPGSASGQEAAIVARQMRGKGGMVSLVIRGGSSASHRFLHALRLVHVASSLGGVESLVSVPAETSHRQLTPEERARRGIDDGMVRLSLGIEDPADLIADLRSALSHV